MNREAIGIGETLEKAKEEACKLLGVDLEDMDRVEFDVIQMPEKKRLGLFGGKEAKVKASISLSRVERAKEYIEGVLKSLNLNDAEIVVLEENEENATLVIKGEGVSMLIGRHGESLDALQYLACLVANHDDEAYYRIQLDIGNYRRKREETLKALGNKYGMLAAKKGRTHSFEPMNPYERRIIHTAVQDIKGAVSWSEGENIRRHVVIGPDPNVKQNNSKRGQGRGSRNGYYSKPRANAARGEKREPKALDTVSDKAVPLYSKIEVNKED